MVLAVKSSIVSRIATAVLVLCWSVPSIHAFSLMKPVVKQPSSRSSSSLHLSSSSSSSAHLQPPFPYPTSPEEAIQNQLHYYQTNQLSKAYHNCCSPGNKKATGSLLEFERLVNLPPYDLIVGHERADVFMELVTKPPSLQQQSSRSTNIDLADVIDDGEEDEEEGDDDDDDDDDTIVKDVACCLVCIRPNRKSRNNGHPVWFWWEMSLIEMSTEQTMITKSIAEDVGYDDDLFASVSTLAVSSSSSSSSSSSVEMTGTSTDTAKKDTITRWMVDCIQPDFEDLEFETEYLSIENFLDDPDNDDDVEEGDDDDDDEFTIYWDFNM